jgi:putative ATPase
MNDLFGEIEENAADDVNRPLADRMRPRTFDEVLGQDHLLAKGTLFANALASDGVFPSIIFWGTPGCGKTTMARLIADHTDAKFVMISAITSATAELRKIFERAQADKSQGRRTLLLVDEIHRFNRSQQDLFLPFIENGTIIVVGATTENPSFELNSALLSRCKVLVLNRIDEDALLEMTKRAEEFMEHKLNITDEAREMLCALADGDGRYLLGMCEDIFNHSAKNKMDADALLKLVGKRKPIYDKSQDGHFNLLSAFHKSMRASDADAALYWAARMLDGGEEPSTIIRRMVACSAEDVGMADPQALIQALAAKDAYEYLGWPECKQSMAQAIVYICTAPKSNAVYMAMNHALADARQGGSMMPPKHALNAPTSLMKDQGYNDGYIYDHDTSEGYSGQSYFPDDMERRSYYQPQERGFERDIKKRMDYFAKSRKD